MANLTLAIDDDLLQRARQAALRENTSVNALVRDFLGSYVDARSRRLAALSDFEAIAATTHNQTAEPWSRESLHERP
jgi:predicted transcriptional regulator